MQQNTPGSAYGMEDATQRFEMVALLGRGAYGSVYKAVDRTTDDTVAIKVISTADSDEDDLTRIHREIQFLSDCDHPNVVRYLGSFRVPEALWIVMEHCGGGSVGDLLQVKGEGLEEEQIAYICAESLKGLAYLHSLGKVHRDIKCGNILLTEQGGVKLADFGVAAQLTNTMTKRNTFIGTPHWMAPEVIQESRYDGKVDVWALGISAIEMAELTPPRWRVHPLRVIFMISREPPPGLAQPERWSDTFKDFLTQCLHKAAGMRPTARYLQQHRFVVNQRPSNATCLMPLVDKVQAHLRERTSPAPSTSTLMAGGGSRRGRAAELAGGATGQFSWKAGNTVLAGRGQLQGTFSNKDIAIGSTVPSGAVAAHAAAAVGAGSSSSAWGDTVLISPGNQAAAKASAAAAAAVAAGSAAWGDIVLDKPAAAANSSSSNVQQPAGLRSVHTGTMHVTNTVQFSHPSAAPHDEPSDFMVALASARAAAAAAGVPGSVTTAASVANIDSSRGTAAYGTVVVSSDAAAAPAARAGADVLGLGFTNVLQQQQQQQQQEEEDDSYMAALKSAAADREREQQQQMGYRGGAAAVAADGQQTLGSRNTAAAAATAAAVSAAVPGHPLYVQRLFERLASYYESGLVVQLPFLSAAHAAPLGLLNPAHNPCSAPLTGSQPGGVQGLDPEAHAVMYDLANGGIQQLLATRSDAKTQQPGRACSRQQQQQSSHTGYRNSSWGNSFNLKTPKAPGFLQRGKQHSKDLNLSNQLGEELARVKRGLVDQQQQQQLERLLPAHIVHKALQDPAVQNLARSIAYHRACLLELPIGQAAATELVQVIVDMSAALQTILCL